MTVFCRDCRWIDRMHEPPLCGNPKQAVQDLVLGTRPACRDCRADPGLRQMINPYAVSDFNTCGPNARYFEAEDGHEAAGSGERGAPGERPS